MSTVHQRQDRDSEAYWFERNGAECTFRPDLSKPGGPGGPGNDATLAIPGAGKQVERLTRGRKEAAFKKMMTERSAYSPTRPAKTARPATALRPFKSSKLLAGQDGSQPAPKRHPAVQVSQERIGAKQRQPLSTPRKRRAGGGVKGGRATVPKRQINLEHRQEAPGSAR